VASPIHPTHPRARMLRSRCPPGAEGGAVGELENSAAPGRGAPCRRTRCRSALPGNVCATLDAAACLQERGAPRVFCAPPNVDRCDASLALADPQNGEVRGLPAAERSQRVQASGGRAGGCADEKRAQAAARSLPRHRAPPPVHYLVAVQPCGRSSRSRRRRILGPKSRAAGEVPRDGGTGASPSHYRRCRSAVNGRAGSFCQRKSEPWRR